MVLPHAQVRAAPPRGVLAGAVIALALTGGLVGTVWQAGLARQAPLQGLPPTALAPLRRAQQVLGAIDADHPGRFQVRMETAPAPLALGDLAAAEGHTAQAADLARQAKRQFQACMDDAAPLVARSLARAARWSAKP